MVMKKLSLFTCAVFLFLVSIAQAGAVLHLGSPPNSGTYLYGSEVLPISDTNLGILENGSGQPTLVDPLLLIIGVANQTDSTYSAPIINLSTGTGILGGSSYFSGTWNATTGYAGNFTSAASGDVYSFIGLIPGGNNSNNFGNWAAADLYVNGITATGFGIFVYELTGTGITGGNQVDVTFASELDLGTFAVAYGQDAPQWVGGKKGHWQYTAFTTPFTESGLTNKVPEPSTLLLFGIGLLGLGFFGRKNI